MRNRAILLVGLLAGCAGGQSALHVTVDASGLVSGVDALRVVVVHDGVIASPVTSTLGVRLNVSP